MLKVSFRKNKQFPAKRVWRNDKTKETFVVLNGVAKLPLFLQYFMPHEIFDWMDTCKNVQAELTMTTMHLTIKGKAKRADSDTDNPILAERIAECRAKINLYKFMMYLCANVLLYYNKVLYGDKMWVHEETPDTLYITEHKYRKLYGSEVEHLKALLAHGSDTESTSQS